MFLRAKPPAGGGSPTLTKVYEGYFLETDNTPNNFSLSGTGAAAGDWFIIHQHGDNGTSGKPAAFTSIVAQTANGTVDAEASYKTLDSTDISNGYVTLTGDAGFNGMHFQVWIVRSSSGTIAVDTSGSAQGSDVSGAGTTAPIPSITPTSGAFIMESASTRGSGTAWTSTPGSPATTDHTVTGGWSSLYAGSWIAASGSATGTRNAVNDNNYAQYVALITSVKAV